MGVERYTKEQGHNLIFVRFDYSPDNPVSELSLPSVIAERGTVDGLIVAGTNYANFIEGLRDVGVPFVVFANNLNAESGVEGLNWVGFDNEDGMRQATEYLIHLSHRDIWCIADTEILWYARCFAGYAKAMSQAGLEPRRVELPQKESPFQYGRDCAAWLVKNRVAITAIVAGDDEIALGVLATLRENEIRVPEDLSLVGFDDVDELKYFRPALTTVRVEREKVGEELAKLLFELLQAPKNLPIRRMVPTKLIIRESCA